MCARDGRCHSWRQAAAERTAACMPLCRYVQALQEAAMAAPEEAQREEYGAQAARLFGRTRTLMQRWSGAFQVPNASVSTPRLGT